MKLRIGDFLRCTRGVIAVEFALVLPIMAMLWFGIVEFGSAHLIARKVEVAAQSVADLVGQEISIEVTDLDDIVSAIDTILAPFPRADSDRGYTVTSIAHDGTSATAQWHRAVGTLSTVDGATVVTELPADLLTGNDSVIVVTVSYSHVPWAARSFVAPDSIALSETMYAKPRLIESIPCSDCPAP